MEQGADALAALAAHYRAMPPVAAMQVALDGWDGETLRLSAPLALHVNDKGSAFGGSLVSLLTLAGWGLVTLRLRDAGLDAEVYVADSQVRYLAPLYDDLRAGASGGEGADWNVFLGTLRNRGRARIDVAASVPLPGGGIATEARSRYVAIAKRQSGPVGDTGADRP